MSGSALLLVATLAVGCGVAPIPTNSSGPVASTDVSTATPEAVVDPEGFPAAVVGMPVVDIRRAQELRASGETARKRDVSTLVKLTPMELKVAQLVASGLSNKDVAAQIWVSPRTVAFHLRNVFAKAGVTSRGELAQLELS